MGLVLCTCSIILCHECVHMLISRCLCVHVLREGERERGRKGTREKGKEGEREGGRREGGRREGEREGRREGRKDKWTESHTISLCN